MVKGGAGLRVEGFLVTSATVYAAFEQMSRKPRAASSLSKRRGHSAFGGKSCDLLLTLAYKTQGHTLHTARRQGRLDLLPQHRAELEADYAVENAARLLGVDAVDIYLAGIGDGIEDGRFGDLVENYAVRVLRLKAEHFVKMPGYGLSLTVLIGCEPDGFRLLGCGLKLLYKLLLVGRDLILRREIALDIDAHAFLLQVTDMAETRHDLIVGAQKFLYCLRLGRRLDYY